MSSPVVVQGVSVPQPQPVAGHAQGAINESPKKGCNDPIFAALFYVAVIGIAAVAFIYGPGAFEDANDANDANEGEIGSYDGYIYAVLVTGVISLVVSGLGLWVLMKIPEFLIKAALLFSVVMSGLVAVAALLSGSFGGAIVGLVFFAIGVCYAYAVWSRIPFATANLVTSITAVKANLGVAGISYVFAILGMGWTVLWSIAVLGVYESVYSCDAEGNCSVDSAGLLFLLFVAFYFVHQVFQNSVHTTVAGVVGTWWVAPNESGFCGSAVINSFIRTVTTSFGSICFGSLLVAIIQALRAMAESARDSGEGGIGLCIAQCILSCLASLLEYFNKWAFTYVGIYGYPYLEAGKNVITLFKNRGWEAIIADDLVDNAIFLVALVVGLIMGALGVALERSTDFLVDAGGNATLVGFVMGFIVGFAVCILLLATISSGVNTVIVMYADAPAEFERNHPELSRKMREAWTLVYPGSV